MNRRGRILDELRPGTRAAIADRDPGWTGGPDYEGLTHDELEDEARAVLARDVEQLSSAQVPADHKWLTQALVAAILVDAIEGLDLRWPQVSEAAHEPNVAARRELDAEDPTPS